jgi:WD40 repeat protein
MAKRIAVVGVAGKIGIWETASWGSIGDLGAAVSGAALSPDATTIVLDDGSMWVVATPEKTRDVPSAHSQFLSPDGRLLASVNSDFALLDFSTSRGAWQRASGSDVAGAAFSPDGMILVAAMVAGVLEVWGVPSSP